VPIHRTSVCTLSGELGQLAPIGIEGIAIDPVVERNQLEDWRERLPRRAILSVLSTLAERAGHDAPDLARAIARQDPDVLLVDINCLGAATVAEASGRLADALHTAIGRRAGAQRMSRAYAAAGGPAAAATHSRRLPRADARQSAQANAPSASGRRRETPSNL
jgi:hypothetical protein